MMRKTILQTVEPWNFGLMFDRLPEKLEAKKMVKQTKYNIAGEIDKLNETETLAVVNYISQLLSKRINSKQKENFTNDDLIVSLSDAPENRRARQVFEWEKVRRQNIQRAVWEN